MSNLILVIISIVLMSAMVMASVSYVPASSIQLRAMQITSISGFTALEGSVTRYLKSQRNATGQINYPGSGINLMGQVVPAYGFLPIDVKDSNSGSAMVWSLKTDLLNGQPAVGVCLQPTGPSSSTFENVLAAIKSSQPVGSSFTGTDCNATSDVVGGTVMTRWLVLAHIE